MSEGSAAGAAHEKVRLLLADALKIDPTDVREDMKLQELPTWDSLGALSLLTGLESEFEITLDPVTLFEAQSPSQIRSLIDAATASRSFSV